MGLHTRIALRHALCGFIKMNFGSSPVKQQVKDPTLSPLWLGSLPWPGTFHMPWVQPNKQRTKTKQNANYYWYNYNCGEAEFWNCWCISCVT